MQPYFFPYGGYFRLLAAVDEFVIFDCVQFRRNGRIHRTQVPSPEGALRWLTLPIAYSPRDTLIRDICFADSARELLDERLSAQEWLRKAKGEGADAIRGYLYQPLPTFNGFLQSGLELAAGMLGLPTKFRRSSELGLPPALRAQARVIAIAKALNASTYLNLPGGKDLYDASAFAREGLELKFMPEYEGPHFSMLHSLATGKLEEISSELLGSGGG
jgi:hypothetical protein